MQQQGRLVNVKGLVYSWQVKNVRARQIALSVSSLLLSILTPISIPQATAAPALVTCVNIESGAERISRTGNCRIGREAQANWHKNQTDSPIASGTSAKVIVICSNKESSPVAYQVIRKKCARHQVSTLFSRSGSLPTKPVIAEAVSYGHDNASLKLAADPAAGLDAPVAYYTIAVRNVDTSTATKIESKRIYSWKDLGLIVGGLQGRTTYTFTVTATTVDGTSAVSIASIPVTTPAYVPPASTSSSSGPTLAVPAFTLSSTSETKMVNNAISGYTISSTGGAIASYAISPAAPAGLTFNTATGLLSGTPTSTQSATTYTITATNASGSATATFALTVQAALSAPVISLSKIAETTTAFIASVGFGYTIDASAGGAVASYALTGTLPTGLTFDTSTGLITGTPEETRTATTYTITATNAAGSTSATYRLRVTGDLGDTGPGGGKIFYFSSAGFNCGPSYTATGSPTGVKCRYLEVAPSGWNGGASDPEKVWASFNWDTLVPNVSARDTGFSMEAAVGLGYKDSVAIVEYGNDTTTAAGLARAYSGGSKSDWYLPSPAELNLLCQWSRGVPSNVTSDCTGGTHNSATYGASTAGLGGWYWTSTQSSSFYRNYGPLLRLDSTGGYISRQKNTTNDVRPIRAF
jgi:hypothetical protein